MSPQAETLVQQFISLPPDEQEELLAAFSTLPTPAQLAELERRYEEAKDKPGIPSEEVHARARQMLADLRAGRS